MPLFPLPEDAAFTSSETLRALLRNKMAIKLEEITKVSPNDLPFDDDDLLERKDVLDPALGHLLENVTSLALNSEQREMSPNIMSSLSLYPKLEDFTKRMIEKRYNEEVAKNKPTLTDAIENLCSDNGLIRETGHTNVTVPSYEAANARLSKNEALMFEHSDKSADSTQRMSRCINQVNFKDMIVQYIGQTSGAMDTKEPTSLLNEPLINSPKTVGVPCQSMSQSAATSLTKEKRTTGKKRTGSPLNSGGKGSRPKRGKYRNYDRENLIKAVQAVQSGEMSVHRAGSFYGVPHSTLEYKVKERHLNRGKKKDSNALPSAQTLASKNISITNRPTMVPTNSFTLDKAILSKEFQQRCGGSDSTTIDLTEETINSHRESALAEAYHVAKKIKFDNDELDENNQPSNQNNPFNLWNTSPSMLPNFMSTPYERESFYASQMIRRFQEAASGRFSKDYSARSSSLSPPIQHSEQGSPMQGQSSGSCSPNLEKERQGIQCETKSSVLDALLRGKSPLEAAAASIHPNSPQPSADFNASPWSVSSRLFNLSKQLTKVQDEKTTEEEIQSGSTSTSSGLAAFNALCSLPSVLGLQTSLAVALQQRISPTTELHHKESRTSDNISYITQLSGCKSPSNQSPVSLQIETAFEENAQQMNRPSFSDQDLEQSNQNSTSIVADIMQEEKGILVPTTD